MGLRTRKPTGAIPWPCVLVEGGEGSGKSWLAAQLTTSERVGKSYWLELGPEGSADEYGAIPGARYEMIVHDGTWADITGQISAVRDEAQKAVDAGEPPIVLVIDTITAEWEMLSEWADNRARERENRKRASSKRAPVPAEDPVTIGMDLWNDSKYRHRKLMTDLLTGPWIVVLLARSGEVAKVESGRPVENQKDYKVRAEKDVAFDANVWVRLDRVAPPQILKIRSVHAGLRPGHDKSMVVRDLSLEWLIFEHMKCDPKTARVRDIVPLRPGSDDLHAEEVALFRRKALEAQTEKELKTVWESIENTDLKSAVTTGADESVSVTLAQLVKTRLIDVRAKLNTHDTGSVP